MQVGLDADLVFPVLEALREQQAAVVAPVGSREPLIEVVVSNAEATTVTFVQC